MISLDSLEAQRATPQKWHPENLYIKTAKGMEVIKKRDFLLQAPRESSPSHAPGSHMQR